MAVTESTSGGARQNAPAAASIKVLHVMPGLESGGAEMLLYKLIGAIDRSRFENVVVSLTDEGPLLGRKIRDASVPLHSLGFSRGIPNPALIARLARLIKAERPAVVHTWMYHANVVGSLACAMIGHRNLVWGIHNARLDPPNMKRQTLQTISLNRAMARLPRVITCSSEAARSVHIELGFPAGKLITIDNGIDIKEFVPDPATRPTVRGELGIAANAPVVGMVARFSRQKDHATFFRAAGELHRRRPDARFVLCGMEVSPENAELRRYAREAGVDDATILLGLYPGSTSRLNAAFDVATSSSSFGESFCIALGEAMACGTPCVTTDMEGPATLVGDTGTVVPIGDAGAMAAAWEKMIDLGPAARAEIAARARERILAHYSLDAMVRRYEDVYRDVATGEYT